MPITLAYLFRGCLHTVRRVVRVQNELGLLRQRVAARIGAIGRVRASPILPQQGNDIATNVDGQMLRSGPSVTPTIVIFKNVTGGVVQAFWIDYNGRKVAYARIQPGGQIRQPTYMLHPWTFQDVATEQPVVVQNNKLVAFPRDAVDGVMTISRPNVLPWTIGNHGLYPLEFQVKVKVLLLCYYRSCLRLKMAEYEVKGPASVLKSMTELYGHLPLELVLHIIKLSAPEVLDVQTL